MLAEELRNFVNTLKVDYELLSDYIVQLEREIDAKRLSEESGRKIIKKVQDSRKNIEAALEKFTIPR